MSVPEVRIGQLRLRASGLTREDARRLGELVARGLAGMRPSPYGPRNISSISVSVRPSSSVERTAAEIVAGIRRTLR